MTTADGRRPEVVVAVAGAPAGGWGRAERLGLGIAILLGAAVRAALLPSAGMTGDADLFAGWIHRLATDVPLGRAFDLDMTFGPVMALVFGLTGALVPAFQEPATTANPAVALAVKLPAVIADLAITGILIWWFRDRPRIAIAAAAAVLLVPATWYVSGWWGQFESVYALFGLGAALLAMRGRWVWAGIVLALALATKPQAVLFVVPLAAFATARLGARRALIPIAATAVAVVGLWLPFVADGGPAAYLRTVVGLQGDEFAVLSLRAWNPWWIVQSTAAGDAFLVDSAPVLGPLTPRMIGYAAAGLGMVAVFMLVRRHARPSDLLLGLAAAVLAGFCLLTTMHERYSFAALIFLAPLLGDRRVAGTWLVLAGAVTLNLFAARPPTGLPGSWIPVAGPIGILGAVIITGVLIAALVLLREGGRRAKEGAMSAADPGP